MVRKDKTYMDNKDVWHLVNLKVVNNFLVGVYITPATLLEVKRFTEFRNS
jgi:hypothetical protein